LVNCGATGWSPSHARPRDPLAQSVDECGLSAVGGAAPEEGGGRSGGQVIRTRLPLVWTRTPFKVAVKPSASILTVSPSRVPLGSALKPVRVRTRTPSNSG